MSQIRRLVAIMAVDVVGFSRLMGADEVGTAVAVREHREAARPLIVSKGGRIVKTMGDGLLLEFPSVVAAVGCALDIQRLMAARNVEVPEAKRIIYRIGINLGDVLIDGEDILGDGVNIAARLEGLCVPGGVLISSTSHDHVLGKIEADFVDLGEKTLKNIAKPVRVFSVAPSGSISKSLRAVAEQRGPPRLSLIVLPFANLGGDAEHEYFVDGVIESLTTDLSRIAGAFIIARNTAFTLKGKPVDVKEIGRVFNVRYVLEGSIQRGGARMRVNVQLVETESGAHLWAERFDKPVSDLFEMQDEIVARLANQLGTELVAVEARRAARLSNPDALDYYFQGQTLLHKGFNPETYSHARKLFARALEIDPDCVDALASAAMVEAAGGAGFWIDSRSTCMATAETFIRRSLSLAPSHAHAILANGVLLTMDGRAEQGVSELIRCTTLNANLAVAHGFLGLAKYLVGKAEETEGHVFEALRLSPRDYAAPFWFERLGMSQLLLGRIDEGLNWLRRASEMNPNNTTVRFRFAAALALNDKIPEARREVRAALVLNPTYTLRHYLGGIVSENPIYLAQRERVTAGMRLAGVPEH